jgi:rubrerythrin
MREMTKENLKNAFAGESQAHMKYLAFAQQAEREGKTNTARLFKAIAFAEQVHAINHLKALGQVVKTADNLQAAINGENFEVDEMYPAYDAVAELQEEKNAKKSFYYAIEAEKIHSVMYSEASEKVLKGEDISDEAIFVCPVCGHTIKKEAPEKCPICNLPKDKYVKF